MRMRTQIAFALFFIASIGLFAGNSMELPEKIVGFDAGGMIHVKTDDGDIQIVGWDKNEVVVQAIATVSGWPRRSIENRIDDVKVYVEKSGNELKIWARYPRNMDVNFRIKAPTKSNFDIRTDDGEIEIEKIVGDIEIETEDGDVEIYETQGDLRINTDDGEVVMRDVVGNLDLRTNDGDVSGSIEPKKRVYVKADDATIHLDLRVQKRDNVAVFVSTDDGDVRSDFPVYTHYARSSYHDNEEGGEGEIQVEVRTNDGDIRLARLNH